MKPLDFLANSDAPKLTDAEAAQLRCVALSVFNHYALQHAGLVTGVIRGRPSRKLTPRGAQALAAYDAEQRRKILADFHRPRPFSEWHDDEGDVLWFVLPIEEAPYCGTPNSEGWPWRPIHHEQLHWCRLPVIFFRDGAVRAMLAKETP